MSKGGRGTDVDPPVIWLLGKTGAGKTSIVAELTGLSREAVGNGFEPTTRTMRVYPFPAEDPIVRFLDTRGLGDVERDDEAQGITEARRQAQLILVVVRANDRQLDDIVSTVREAREAHPDWPVIVAQTTLHNLYPHGSRHPLPDPFTGGPEDDTTADVPGDLRNNLSIQRRLFADLPGTGSLRFVPLDFTRPEQGLPPGDFGIDRLLDALVAVRIELLDRLVERHRGSLDDRIRTRLVLPLAALAAATNAVPVPLLGGFGSTAFQVLLVREIARRRGLDAGIEMWREFLGAMGAGFALSFGASWLVQQVLKLGIGPGSAAVATWTFAVTWGIGEAALYFFKEKAAGRSVDPEDLRRRFRRAADEGRARHAADREKPA